MLPPSTSGPAQAETLAPLYLQTNRFPTIQQPCLLPEAPADCLSPARTLPGLGGRCCLPVSLRAVDLRPVGPPAATTSPEAKHPREGPLFLPHSRMLLVAPDCMPSPGTPGRLLPTARPGHFHRAHSCSPSPTPQSWLLLPKSISWQGAHTCLRGAQGPRGAVTAPASALGPSLPAHTLGHQPQPLPPQLWPPPLEPQVPRGRCGPTTSTGRERGEGTASAELLH